jgi:hypothetical protein
MKILVYSVMLIGFASVSAAGGESPEILRDRLILCSQFVIEHPYPTIVADFSDSTECCRHAKRGRDCHVSDLGVRYR